MKKVLLASLLLLAFIAPLCFAKVNLKVKVNVNNRHFVPVGDYPIIQLWGGEIKGTAYNSYQEKEKKGVNPATFRVYKHMKDIRISAELPYGDKQTKTAETKSDDVTYTFNFTCNPSNKLIVENCIDSEYSTPLQAQVYLMYLQNNEKKLHAKLHTNNKGEVRFNSVGSGYPLIVEGRPDSESYHIKQIQYPPFVSDFQTRTVKIKYKRKPGTTLGPQELSPPGIPQPVPDKPQIVPE